jgi:prepilin-type processing-associated H-X9-DG protein/prepilin-type N-terminal cleavage/methylation domain-containing protein
MRSDSRKSPVFGFTLVELLVVIGIIAVLISILLPVLSKARAVSNKIKCMSNIRQFMMADQMYINEWKGFHIPSYVDYNNDGLGAMDIWSANPAFRRSLSMRLIGPTEVQASPTTFYNGYVPYGFICPSATRFISNVSSNDHNDQLFPMALAYGMNVEGISSDGNLVPNPTPWAVSSSSPTRPGSGCFGYKRSQVRRAAEKLRFVDAISNQAMGGQVDESGSGVSPGTGGKISNYDKVNERTGTGTLPGGGSYNANMMTAWRHQGGANVAFFDGHAEWLRKDLIYTTDAAGNIIGNDKLWKVLQ